MSEFIDIESASNDYDIIVPNNQPSIRLDKFLLNHMYDISRTKIQASVEKGFVTVNNTIVRSNYRVRPKDQIRVSINIVERNLEVIPENIPIDIVFEDDHVLVLNKQSGMVVHPGFGNYTGTLVNALVYHVKSLPLNSGDISKPGLVHRLDKNTTGIMVIAKNDYAMNHLSKQFFERTVDRRYHALVWGDVIQNEGSIQGNIGRSLKNRKIMSVFLNEDYGKYAKTNYKVLERFGYVSLLECKLDTGRTHQIRVHLQYVKHPLFNDSEYGGDKVLKGTTFTKYKQFVENCFKIIPRQSLHAKSLSFNHPETGVRMSFDSELPEDLENVLFKWRNYSKHQKS